MKHIKTPARPVSPDHEPAKSVPSRRKFLQSAGVAGMAAVTLPIAGIALDSQENRRSDTQDSTEQALSRLSRYGSEFGDLKRVT